MGTPALARRIAIGVLIGSSAGSLLAIHQDRQQRLALVGASNFSSGGASSGVATSPADSDMLRQQPRPPGPPGQQPPGSRPRAINLRDLGEAAPGVVRPGVLYRCSQVYSQDLLKELRIKTVVDLRGRNERRLQSKKHRGAAPTGPLGGEEPPPLFGADHLDRLRSSDGGGGGDGAARPDASTGGEEFEAGLVTLRRETSAASFRSQGSEDEAQITDQGTDTVTADIRAGGPAKVAARGGGGGGDVLASMSSLDDDSESDGPSSGDRERGAALMGLGGPEAAAAAAAAAGGGMLDTLNFNLIPAKEFGLQMLRMPKRVWLASLGNLVTLKDPRKPFVEAFADNQLLGFTRYYTIILEHSKTSIAGVLRVFARDGTLPALVHCAHGKDRTGVVIMLLLAACGVPQEVIVDDYIESEKQLRAYRESLGLPPALWATGAPIPLSDVIIASTQETMRALLLYLEERYPLGADSYLESCGLTPAEIDAIRVNLMTQEALEAFKQQRAAGWRHAPRAGAGVAGSGDGGDTGEAGGQERVRAAVEGAKAAAGAPRSEGK